MVEFLGKNLLQVRQQLPHVVPKALHLPVLLEGQSQHTEMHANAVVGKAAGDFAADDHVRPIGDRQRAVDTVVVGDGHEIHASRLGPPVHAFR